MCCNKVQLFDYFVSQSNSFIYWFILWVCEVRECLVFMSPVKDNMDIFFVSLFVQLYIVFYNDKSKEKEIATN